MFKPIIHNLQPGDKGYAEVTQYNLLVGYKPTSGTLAQKIEAQAVWKKYCNAALDAVKLIMEGK